MPASVPKYVRCYGHLVHCKVLEFPCFAQLRRGQLDTLAELEKQPRLLQRLLLVKDKEAVSVTVRDARELAPYMTRHLPGTDGYDTWLKAVTA